MGKSFTLSRDESEKLIYLLIEKSGLANELSIAEKQQLASDTCDNLDKAGIELNRENILEKDMLKKIMLSITATHVQNVAKKYGLEYDFDFKLLSKDEKELTPGEKKEVDAVEKLTDLSSEKEIVEFIKELDAELRQGNAPSPKFKMQAVYSEDGNKIMDVGPMVESGRGGSKLMLSSFYEGDIGNLKSLLQEEYFGSDGIVVNSIKEAGFDSMSPKLEIGSNNG